MDGTRRALEQFDPTELKRRGAAPEQVDESRRALEQFDPTELTQLADESRQALEQFDPRELTRLVDEARRANVEETEARSAEATTPDAKERTKNEAKALVVRAVESWPIPHRVSQVLAPGRAVVAVDGRARCRNCR